MESFLYINSSFKRYNMCLHNEGEIIFSTHYAFKTYTKNSKLEELQKSSLANTEQLIKCAQDNNINSFGVKIRGPLHIYPLNIESLNEHKIDITYIMDKTPIPHNACRPRKREKAKIKAPIN